MTAEWKNIKLHCLAEEEYFHEHVVLKFKEGNNKMLYLEHSFVWSWNVDTSEEGSEIPWRLWNAVLEKDVEGQLDWSCEECRRIT
jgi:hypothetical protein